MEDAGFRMTHPLALGAAGFVMTVSLVAVKSDVTSLGTVAGGVTGALASNRIGKNVKNHYRYRVTTVGIDDGSVRTISQSIAPTVAVRDRVRIANDALVAHY